MAIELRSISNSGLKVAPLALGGNVFGWTADEATSFRILDAFVDALRDGLGDLRRNWRAEDAA